jgi:peptidoglycan hydrolase CwlO-like protein
MLHARRRPRRRVGAAAGLAPPALRELRVQGGLRRAGPSHARRQATPFAAALQYAGHRDAQELRSGPRLTAVRILLLAALLSLGRPALALSAEATPSAAPAYGQYQADAAAAARIAQAVAADDAAIVRAQADLATLRAQAAALQARLPRLRAQVADLSRQVAAQQVRVDAAVRFLYEDGGVSFLAVLLQATSFSDFLTRFSLVAQVVAAEVGLLRTAAADRAALARQQADLAAASAHLASATAAQAAILARLQQDQAARSAALAAARQQASAAAAALAALDQTLLQGLPELNRVLAEWAQLPWAAVQPDDVSVDLAAAVVTVTLSASSLNTAIGIAPLALAIAPDGVALTAAGMRLSGPISLQGGDLLWVPDQLTVGGAPAGPGVLPALLSGRELAIPVPAPAPGLRAKALHLGNGSLVLDFGL